MPNYNYYCNRCDLNYSELRVFEDRNKKITCPECGKRQCPLTYDNSKNADGRGGMVIKGGSTPNFYGTDSRKAQEKEWMHDEVENTKQVLKYETGKSPYSRMKIPYEALEKKGVVKKVSEGQQQLKIKGGQNVDHKAGKKMTEGEIKRAGTRGDAD